MEKTITFSIQGKEITGTLHGNAHLWMFESENEFIKSNFTDGRISRHTLVKHDNGTPNLIEIYSIICEEAEIPGF